MAPWSRKKRVEFESAFYDFLGESRIYSKDLGQIVLGDHLYRAQRTFFTAVFDGMEQDIHTFDALKSRQLGISTSTRGLKVFWVGMHDGMSGACIFDTDTNKQNARREIENVIQGLPPSLGFPKIKANNRNAITLENDSTITFMSAGVKKSKSSGTLGRSLGISCYHASELCSYDNEEGWEAFLNSCSDVHPNRLYIRESTARGFNSWHDVWQEDREDEAHVKCVFLGWWSKDSQVIDRHEPDFELYGIQPPTDKEIEKIELVKKLYGWQITPEQLAWVRRKSDPTGKKEGDAPAEYTPNVIRLQEQPWVEEDAWQMTGSVFFTPEKLADQANKNVSKNFTTWYFAPGIEFTDMRVYKPPNNKSVELKVWEPPQQESVYVVAADPAFGSHEDNDRSAIQVFRCYADGCDQVAEYAWPLIGTRPFAWVILALCGWYAKDNSDIYLIVELNGPGAAVWDEIDSTRKHINAGYQPQEMEDKGLANVFWNVKNYTYSRPDSLSSGKALMWKCLSVYERLPTPYGWTTMGDVMPDDVLLDEQGKPCNVLFTSEVKEGKECYRITFEDKTSIIADAEHLWEVSVRKPKTGKYTKSLVTTENLDSSKHNIAVTKPLDLEEIALPIDPYVLGVWLGDGSSIGGKIHCGVGDIDELSGFVSEAGYGLGPVTKEKKNERVCYRRIIGLTSKLSAAGLIDNKHIPRQYLRASKEQRMELLCGLMDTDGNVNKPGKSGSRMCYFTTTSPKIAEGFAELVRTLGFKSKHVVRNRTVKYKGKDVDCAPAWQFYFTAYEDDPVFKLARKRSRISGGRVFANSKTHRIKSVVKVDSVPVRCIQVDSPSSLFLAGEGMIPTHNTSGGAGPAGKVRLMERLRDFTDNGMFKIRSLDTLEEMRSVTRDGDTIAAQGKNKDDRVMACALGIRCWEERVRRTLSVSQRTRERELAKLRLTPEDRYNMFTSYQFQQFLGEKKILREREMRALRAHNRRFGRR